MLTKGDDYPIHQTPDPIAYAGTSDRNFYDRYFFNGYTWDGDVYFTTALGVYPHVNIMDAGFSVVHKGVQHNIRASRHLNMERMDMNVGPIEIQVLEPLQSLRILVNDDENEIYADITFHGRTKALKEPRFTVRNGPRTVMDYTRLTQNGTYEGWIDVKGERIELTRNTFVGTRDRSWGIRPIGLPDPQPMVPATDRQFYWFWAPLNFEDRITLFHVNEHADGEVWNENAVMAFIDDTEPEKMEKYEYKTRFKSGTRHLDGATIFFEDKKGKRTKIELDVKWNYYMVGLGYGNPEWNHGSNKGELSVAYDTIKTEEVTTSDHPYRHIQAFVTATMTLPDGQIRKGAGIIEQIIAGEHKPSGFKNDVEVAP